MIVFICAPFRTIPGDAGMADLTEEINLGRALALARLAMVRGLSPIVPHLHAPLYREHADGDEAGATRLGLLTGQAQAQAVGRAGGLLWLLQAPGYLTTAGCHAESQAFAIGRRAWLAAHPEELDREGKAVGTWHEWRLEFDRSRLLPLWMAR